MEDQLTGETANPDTAPAEVAEGQGTEQTEQTEGQAAEASEDQAADAGTIDGQ